MDENERFDSVFLGLAQQHEGGVPELMDSFFSFLRRKTDFFVGGPQGQARSMLDSAFSKHERRASDDLKKNEKMELERKKKQEERIAKEKEEEINESQKPRIQEINEEEEKKILLEKKQKEEQAQLMKKELNPDPKTETKVEEDEEDKGKLLPNSGNGSQTDKYRWTQVLHEVELRIPIPDVSISKQNVDIKMQKNRLKAGLKGKPPIIDEEFEKPIKVDDSAWTIEDKKILVFTLSKVNQMEWWSRAFKSEQEITTKKVSPENSKLEDLDSETRGVVEKMMFDQRQKQAGQPTSDEMQKNELLKNFMKQHPEMDFSKAKMG